nr:hypothetical protein [Desulforamulus aquiferis]
MTYITLRKRVWNRRLCLSQRGAAIVGICGGYQMLGKMLYDPWGTEAAKGNCPGLGLLDISTTFLPKSKPIAVRQL